MHNVFLFSTEIGAEQLKNTMKEFSQGTAGLIESSFICFVFFITLFSEQQPAGPDYAGSGRRSIWKEASQSLHSRLCATCKQLQLEENEILVHASNSYSLKYDNTFWSWHLPTSTIFAMKAKFWKGRVYIPCSTILACPMMLTRVGMSACLITLVWARWKYKVVLHHIWYEDYAHHSGHQEWRWQECPRRVSSQRETWRKDIMTQEEDFVRRSRSGVGSGRQHLYALEQVLESGSPVFSRDRLYFITLFINLSLIHRFLSGSPVSSQKPTLFYHFQSVISERGNSRNDPYLNPKKWLTIFPTKNKFI